MRWSWVKFQCRGILLIWIRGGQGPTALAVAAGGCLAIFSLVYHFSYLKRGGRVVRWCWVNFQSRGVLLILIIVGQGPTALAVGAGEGCLDIFFLSSIISLFLLPLSGRRPDIG